jgi:hypothetical protein|eukprot:COSAG01_NODE_17599_length_1138_cov_1.352262_1_plen_117_part_00
MTQALLDESGAAAARPRFEEAHAALAYSAEAGPSPSPMMAGIGEDPTLEGTQVNTWIEIPPQEEMMRQMQLTALRMVCVEGLAQCDLRLGRWEAAAEGATKMIACAPRDVDALLLR